jgi:hypothetical protein
LKQIIGRSQLTLWEQGPRYTIQKPNAQHWLEILVVKMQIRGQCVRHEPGCPGPVRALSRSLGKGREHDTASGNCPEPLILFRKTAPERRLHLAVEAERITINADQPVTLEDGSSSDQGDWIAD